MAYTASARHCTSTKVNVLPRTVVSEKNLTKVRGVTAAEQHPMIHYGDTVSVEFFHNMALDCTGTVTIWHNKKQAAIKTYSTSIAGEWLDSLKLIISDEREEGWTPGGELVTGSLAMDINGVQGIYCCGEFYRNQDMAAVVG
jgi:hypothetical protein